MVDVNEMKCDVVSWSDNRWSSGNSYIKSSWIKEEDLGPDYEWVVPNRDRRVSKQSRSKRATGQPKHLTEKEYNESLGYSRIWDSGTLLFEYKKGSKSSLFC